MPATRLMPTDEAADLIELTREICRKELAPHVDDAERKREFPASTFRTLGQAGLLSLPYPEKFGGADQPYEVYLQVVEEIGTVWMSVAFVFSVPHRAEYPVAAFACRAQQGALRQRRTPGARRGAKGGCTPPCLRYPHAEHWWLSSGSSGASRRSASPFTVYRLHEHLHLRGR